jgi:hypothetical protein
MDLLGRIDWTLIGSIVGNVFISLLTALGFFYWQLQIVVPKVRFSKQISKLPRETGGFRYRVKIENCGSRDMIDIELYARFRVKALRPNFPGNWHGVTIPMGSRIARLRPALKSLMRDARELELKKIDFIDKGPFPAEILQNAADGSLLLEDLLSLGTKRTLQVFVFAYDAFSGSRKLFESPIYTSTDIVSAPFARDSVEVSLDAGHSED